jgi:hypothetical protein
MIRTQFTVRIKLGNERKIVVLQFEQNEEDLLGKQVQGRTDRRIGNFP